MGESASAHPPHSMPPEEFHWVASYLREDIQDIRTEIRGVDARADARHLALYERMDEGHRVLNERIEETARVLNERMDETARVLTERMDETARSLGERIDETARVLSDRIDQVGKRLDTRFTWLMSTMVAMTGIIIAVMKM